MARDFRSIEFLTIDEVASMLRVSKMTVYRRVHSGELPSVHFGRSFRIPAVALEAYFPTENEPPEPSEEPDSQ
ncbi:helix-turn-helix domain-containing protein [Arthrobacter sp. H14]|uniref:helix-turn-helix domain-containing protein n=1 Tax=Arthrobacter sp. H14 TaxID=1312959 RepID=UPI0009DF83D2|nr:helix-turn-helix domain-containing protein [Arthrobacter sp. H14]